MVLALLRSDLTATHLISLPAHQTVDGPLRFKFPLTVLLTCARCESWMYPKGLQHDTSGEILSLA